MPKIYENEIVYNVDTLSRTMDTETGVIRTERIIGVQQGAPKWITKLFNLPETAYVREVVFSDPEGADGPSATCMSMNLNLAQYVSCLEYITYTPYPSGQGAEAPATLFRQRALMLSQFPTAMIARRIERASVERFSSNAGIGRKGFDWVLETGWKRKLVCTFRN
ncbi:hypothetical protein A1Q1_06862 [Trichosporon asahii var. asahii CBS 2479]|uniref:PRELI/MSF1 domain-containing protein n=1 Tax=Trichosporon asahii var. asahii (strain ATCC 90039 / CBS 2479 / JCM 2466 / KCTC 7840 / NBRC 103889/ NCYC 2677 / UAMH 7654) TaxID=1186058 RepID=J6F4H3_TRIAS|nr:hypothetical protein A1Q1_06862 [Trichosporon asahii var. asahii CBS 2479]EJT51909.1 hypothetical protein A1Q1_06862 [Trichosporon asahii var. asahii CBS 2479]